MAVGGHGDLELGDDRLHGSDDRDQPDGGGGESLFDRQRLPQWGCGEITDDLFGQTGDVTHVRSDEAG